MPVTVETVHFSPSSVEPVEIPQVQFLDKLFMPVVVMSGADGQTAQKNCGDSTGAVLGQGVHACCCCGADGQTVQETVEMPQLQFLIKLTDIPVISQRHVPEKGTFLAPSTTQNCKSSRSAGWR